MNMEARLAELQPNPAQVQLNQMQSSALEMANYFRRGFGSALTAIVAAANNKEEEISTKEEIDLAYRMLGYIERLYVGIPYAHLGGKPEFRPLFAVRDILPKLREAVDDLFVRGTASKDDLIMRYSTAISVEGELYANNFRGLLRGIRDLAGTDGFKVQIKHLFKDEVWDVFPHI